MALRGRDLMKKFDDDTLCPTEFGHLAHLEVAWMVAGTHRVDVATDKIVRGLVRLTTRVGAPEKFHHTLTSATVHIIHHRIAHRPHSTFEAFLASNNDLVCDLKSVLRLYYTEGRLASQEARHTFIKPDRRPLPSRTQSREEVVCTP